MKKTILILCLSFTAVMSYTQSIILNDSPEQSNHRLSTDWENPTEALFTGTLTEVLDAAFDSITNMSNLKGFNAAMLLDDGTVWKRAAGLAEEIPMEVPLTTEHLMGMGSISKTFVSATVLSMMEDGLLSLDDSITQHIPAYDNIPGEVTIRQLLSHRSGINDYLNENPATINDWILHLDSIWQLDTLLNNYVLETNFPPDGGWSYSNTNYLLAGRIIESITGEPWHVEVRERVIEPLGLNNTFTFPFESPGNLPFSHAWADWDGALGVEDLQGSGVPMDGLFSMATSAGCLITTPEDLVRFSDGLYNGDLLEASTLAEMQTDYVLQSVPGLEYGLGAASFFLPGNIENWGHDGNLIYKSIALYFPDKNVSLAVQQNDNRFNFPGGPTYIDMIDVFLTLLDACESFVPTSTTEVNTDNPMKVFPNPGSDRLNIQFSENAALDFPVSGQVTDVNGRVVSYFNVTQANTFIDLGHLPAGVYVLRVGNVFEKVVLK